MKGKIHPKGIVSHATGPTNTINDPAKFHGAGKTTGKPDGGAEIVHGSPTGGDTFTVNRAAIGSFPNADKAPPKDKVKSEKCGTYSPEDTAKDKTASQEGPGGPKDRPYPLKTSYAK